MDELEPPAAGLSALGDVVRRTAYEDVLDRLRGAILGGEVEPGTPLVLAELSARLGVSRTPIREAIRDLAAEGLVDFDSYRSAVVHSPTLEEAQEVYDLRLVLEPLAVRRAVPKISDEDIACARELYERMLTTDDLGAWVQLNRGFHAILMEPASSPRLLSIIAGLRNAAATQVAMSIRVVPLQLTRANDDHLQILDAYKRRDTEAAVTIVEQHLRSTIEAIESYERIRIQRDLEASSTL